MIQWGRRLGGAWTFIRGNETKIRFALNGLLNTTFGMATYPALYFLLDTLKLHYLIILVISQIICVTFSFFTNKFLVFKTTGNYLREYRKFGIFHLSFLLVNLVMLPVLVELAGMSPVWGQSLFAILVIISSYSWYSRVAFFSAKIPR